MKKICLVNDFPGRGKIALSAMIPLLSLDGIDVSTLPTALVSNTLDYGLFNILDTTDYMDKTVDIWNQLNFKFDAISTGFMVNKNQINVIEKLIKNQNDPSLFVLVDPILGDDGKLYNGLDEENIEIMRRLSSYASLLIPNFTEATLLTSKYLNRTNITSEEGKDLISSLKALGPKSVVITSVMENNKHSVIGYDDKTSEYFSIDYDYIDVRFPGTGDIFSSILLSGIIKGLDLKQATHIAMDEVRNMIEKNIGNKDKYLGINIEKYISEVNHEN